ncbi:RNA polymerase II-associated protein [Vararia minispora EC-137]|uniref:RNA polymerase II-associated protein n=1 Tax=Vararia minispora EC-137 TaxID=1314806 RepID=A0ACB8QTU3_9AGAM|nr:RNA polymerase II-associated protein [Vararia minispora EC-137]
MSAPAPAADALDALRDAVRADAAVVPTDASGAPAPSLRDATHLRLGAGPVLPKSTPTRLRKAGSSARDPAAAPGDFFSLEAVYVAWALRDASGADYMRQAREGGLLVGFVGVTERKGVAEWVEGTVPTLAQIVPAGTGACSTTPPSSPTASAYFHTLSRYSKASAGKPLSSSRGAFQSSDSLATSATKRPYVLDTADADIVKRIRKTEIELRDHNTVLRGVKITNFGNVKDLYTSKLRNLKDPKKQCSLPSAVPTANPVTSTDPKLLAKKQRSMHPIIIISSSPTSLITMHNVKHFLQDAAFEPSADARARAAAEGNARPEDVIPIYRTRTTIDSSGREIHAQTRYMVVDSVDALNKFGADAWDRVVCVLTTGQAWQFRPYKWPEPRSLFHHAVKGMYVSWSNDPPNPKIKDWNVTELKIDPHRRHVDKSTVAHFWKTLDDWTVLNKPGLMP